MWLRRTEEEVWKLTPRKLQALLIVHHELNSHGQTHKNTPVEGFIDSIPGW